MFDPYGFIDASKRGYDKPCTKIDTSMSFTDEGMTTLKRFTDPASVQHYYHYHNHIAGSVIRVPKKGIDHLMQWCDDNHADSSEYPDDLCDFLVCIGDEWETVNINHYDGEQYWNQCDCSMHFFRINRNKVDYALNMVSNESKLIHVDKSKKDSIQKEYANEGIVG